MNCKRVCEELVFLHVDNEMGQDLQAAYQRHVADCPHCAREAQIIRRFLMIVRERVGRCQAPENLRERIRAGLSNRRGLFS